MEGFHDRDDYPEAETPVEWVVFDAGSVNIIDSTAIQTIDELRDELTVQGLVFAVAPKKPSTETLFEGSAFILCCALAATTQQEAILLCTLTF